MKLFKKKKVVVTHGGGFHSDDLFAVSSLFLLHKGRIKIKRIDRGDFKTIEKADYVCDIGGIYDVEKKRFDHHQKGSPVRENGIPYSSFGLIWKEYGKEICQKINKIKMSEEEAEKVASSIEKRIVIPIDAEDNGVQICNNIFDNIEPYTLFNYLKVLGPSWVEKKTNKDRSFKKLMRLAVKVLKREIKVTLDDIRGEGIIKEAYEESEDKKIIILEKKLPRHLYQGVLSSLPDPLFIVLPDSDDGWVAEAVKENPTTLKSRILFPESWRGELDKNKLREKAGIVDIIFCHLSGFLIVSSSKEGALKAVEKTINN